MGRNKRRQQVRRSAVRGAKSQARAKVQQTRRHASARASSHVRLNLGDRVQFQWLRDAWWPAAVTAAFVVLGLVYFAWWGPVVDHVPSRWTSPDDLGITFGSASAFVHGHWSDVYRQGFDAFAGTLVLFAPVALFSAKFDTALVKVTEVGHGHLVSHPTGIVIRQFAYTDTRAPAGPHAFYIPHPQVLVFLTPYVLLLACLVLFAGDTLARQLDVGMVRRRLLTMVQAVLLWNIVVLWGHPEEAVSVGLALYAVTFVLQGRSGVAGWLFGAAVAVHPLVIAGLPILLFVAGRERALRLAVRSVAPAALTLAPFLFVSFHTTLHVLVNQPNVPSENHRTPWTSLAPHLGGTGRSLVVAAGPGRSVALAAAGLLGLAARRWRNRPDLIVWAVAGALALRCYTESVMDGYYMWPALAVVVIVGARRGPWQFLGTALISVLTTVVAQWHLGLYPWWTLDVVGMTTVLFVASGVLSPSRGVAAAREPALA